MALDTVGPRHDWPMTFSICTLGPTHLAFGMIGPKTFGIWHDWPQTFGPKHNWPQAGPQPFSNSIDIFIKPLSEARGLFYILNPLCILTR